MLKNAYMYKSCLQNICVWFVTICMLKSIAFQHKQRAAQPGVCSCIKHNAGELADFWQ